MSAIDDFSGLPSPEVLRRLAVSDSGFVFDPVSGDSYSLNVTGLAVLRHLQSGLTLAKIVEALQRHYAVDAVTAEREVMTFAMALRQFVK
jgi:hypothetical protein